VSSSTLGELRDDRIDEHGIQCNTGSRVPRSDQETMASVNFTAAIDRDLLKRAKVLAAKAETSVNALVNAELRYLVETFDAAEAAGNQNFLVLLDFSLGRRDGRETMAALGIDSEEDLFLLMAQAHLPMPRLSESATRGMVDELNALAD
jgi:hypothetical protein